MGAKTKKVLFVSTRNTYCCICARAASMGETAKPHVCYKNWTKSSTAMEADIIVEGFRNSVHMHNLKYRTVIGKFLNTICGHNYFMPVIYLYR